MVGLATEDARPNLHYDLIDPSTGINYGKPTKGWRYDKNTMSRLIAEGRIIWPDTPNGRPRKKQYLADLAGLYTGYSSIIGENFYTRTGSNEQLQIWGDIRFDFPKNSGLLQELIEQACDENDIILDSFAGSGTTAHATLNMNKADGGHRKFILVEMEDYADSITAERVRRVIRGYGEGKNAVEGTGGSFSYYELGDSLLIGENLNEAVDPEKIREYIWFMETKTPYTPDAGENLYYLGQHNDTGYYFYYEPQRITVLDYDFLATVTEKAGGTVIYADRCSIDDSKLSQMGIVFKKIPRDISRL